MKILKSPEELRQVLGQEKVHATVGNFDGVHLGHRQFLGRIADSCQYSKAKFLVITFVPHPLQILKATSAFLINTYSERRELLSVCGVDYLLEIDFTRDFSTLSPEQFFERYIFSLAGIEKVYLGHDFAFGANKSGDHRMAGELCQNKKIALELQGEYRFKQETISSTKVRQAIVAGEVRRAQELLGRTYFLSGRVIKGQGRGKQIGFPTANLGFDRELIVPARGVYITQTTFKNMTYNSVTNIGFNPTFNEGLDIHVESHLLDFNHDIYGEEIRVQFLAKLRDEKKFQSVNDLIAQIEVDVKATRSYFHHD